jgi:hypothetical protein
VKNLHSATCINEIKKELEEIGFNTRQIINIKHKLSKAPLPIFFVDLEPSKLNKEIFNVTDLLHTLVKVKEPYKHRNNIQCLNYQEYDHSRSCYAYKPRCVYCGQNHVSLAFQKTRNTHATCALCQENLPFNYKRCRVYKDLQRLHQPTPKHANFPAPPASIKTTNVSPEVSLTDIKNNTTPYFAQVTSNNSSNINPQDNNKILIEFLNEFKSLINPLLALLTTVLKLILKNDK